VARDLASSARRHAFDAPPIDALEVGADDGAVAAPGLRSTASEISADGWALARGPRRRRGRALPVVAGGRLGDGVELGVRTFILLRFPPQAGELSKVGSGGARRLVDLQHGVRPFRLHRDGTC